jgi:peptidoglycan/xylan/chitin deacetylase (PgdA/CDA1 family)
MKTTFVAIVVMSAAMVVPEAKAGLVSLKYEPRQPAAGGSVTFDATMPAGRNDAILSYEWDFGDRSRAWATFPVWKHTYSEPGQYTVTLTIADRAGATSAVTSTLAVRGREFMITFDDGPATESTPYILDQLRQIKKADGTPVKAGFFVVGQDKSQTIYHDIWQPKYGIDHRPGVLSHPDLTRRIAREGHIAAVHTQHHPDLDKLPPGEVEREILDCYQAILDTGVKAPKVFRSPRMHDPNPLPPALQGQWKIVRGDLTKDYLPLIAEDEVIENCRKSIRTAPAAPVVLTFHDFRGLPGHRLDYAKIVNTLTQRDDFTLIDFDADVAAAAARPRDASEQTAEDLQDLLKVWRERLLPSHTP